MTRPLKVYTLTAALPGYLLAVAAPNQKEAARLLGVSLGRIRRYWGRSEEPDALMVLATAEPGTVFRRRVGVYPKPPWERAPQEPEPTS